MTSARIRTGARFGLPPLILAVLLVLIGGHWVRAIAVGAVAVVAATVGFAAPRFADQAFKALGRVIGRILTAVLLGIGVLIPAWAWCRAIGVDPLLAGTGFVDVSPEAGASHPWARERRPRRRIATVARGTVVAAVVLPLLFVAASHARRTVLPTRVVEIDGFAFSPYGHAHEPWAQELFDEQAVQPSAPDRELGYVFSDYDRTYVHVHDLARASWTPPHPTLTVWFFGGSTMFGVGQRDDETIPSEIARLAASDGTRIHALNYGAQGYAVWQESLLFQRLLARARTPPDLVVFYHGVNDESLTCSELEQGLPIGSRITLGSVVKARGPLPRQDCSNPAVLGRDMASVMTENMRSVRAAAERQQVPVVEYLQPDPATKRLAPADAPVMKLIGWTPTYTASHRSMLRIEQADETPHPIDLTGALDHVTQPVFLEYAHTNELGARVIAEAMFRTLEPQLRIAARRH